MSNFFISTNAISSPTRTAVMRLQSDLARVQNELATGRLADAGLSLGAGTAETLTLRQTQTWQSAVAATNAIATSRLDAGQSALSGMVKSAQDFQDQLVGSLGAGAARATIGGSAQSALAELTNQINVEFSGVHLFGGDNGAAPPLADYYATAGSAGRQGVMAAFSAAFGVAPGDASVASITADQMSQFLDGAFAAQFSDPSWTANWSGASSRNAAAQISSDETVEVGANANEKPFRQVAEAYVMVADLGGDRLNSATFQVVLDKAATLVGTAISGLAAIQSRLGISQQRVTSAGERLSVQGNIIANRLTHIERVDPYQATTAANGLITQLQASYAATAQIQKLSILNYL